ncbi:hypothetical protein LCGC14_0384350 [marine sediment metagenome]|uniref:Uncharacterized protein n=1 Tax=marine sediment metagenome TaxID=412755 RepID=A0A0F9VNK4_9ZZZZ
MKRLSAIILLAVILSVPGLALGVTNNDEVVSYQEPYIYGPFRVLEITITADSGDGTLPAQPIPYAINGMVMLVETNPGSTAPTDNYDLTLTGINGADIMGGALTNRDTATTERTQALTNGSYGVAVTHRTLTLNLTNNSVVSADFVIWIYWIAN